MCVWGGGGGGGRGEGLDGPVDMHIFCFIVAVLLSQNVKADLCMTYFFDNLKSENREFA